MKDKDFEMTMEMHLFMCGLGLTPVPEDPSHAGEVEAAQAALREHDQAHGLKRSPGGPSVFERLKGLHCQSDPARSDICRAGQQDGIVCPEDECDIDAGFRKEKP